jgi:hypothetical protein
MKRLAKSESEISPTLLRRRDFLTLGSAGLLAPLFGNLAWAEPLAAAAERSVQTVPMSVGYIDGSEEYRSFKRLPRKIRRPLLLKEEDEAEASPVIVPAESLFQADTSLPGRPLHIHVHGLYPPVALETERRREVPLAVDLEAVFPSPDPAFPTPLRFYAWGLRQKYGWDPSPPTSFRFPLEWQVLPQLILRVWRADGTHHVMRTRFTLDNEPGRPKLRRGVYLLGLTPGAWSRAARVSDYARIAPAEMFSLMVSMDPEVET